MELVNVHCHVLYGVDDGAETEAEMFAMLDAMYADGIRTVCATPHFHPGKFPPFREEKLARFEAAEKYVREKYPDMRLVLGAEIFWHTDAVRELTDGECFTLNGTRRVLVEFAPHHEAQEIRQGVTNLLTAGYIPVVAHVERYEKLCAEPRNIGELRDLGAYIQINSSSVTGRYGFGMKRISLSLVKAGLVDIVADDSHGARDRAPGLSKAYSVIKRRFGAETAEDLFYCYPMRVIS